MAESIAEQSINVEMTLEDAINKISSHINQLIELVNVKRDLLDTLKRDIAQMNKDKRALVKEIGLIEEALRLAGIEAEYMKELTASRVNQLNQAAVQVNQAIQAMYPEQPPTPAPIPVRVELVEPDIVEYS